MQPKGGERQTSTGKRSYRRLWKGGECRQPFTVLVGTVVAHSHIPVSKWLLTIHLLNAGKNGVSALELSRTLGISYRAAWFMAHRIRFALEPAESEPQPKLFSVVESDETYMGGRTLGKRGRGAANKTLVVSLVERNGEARSQVVTNVTGENIRQVLRKYAEADTVLVMDSFPLYEKPGKEFAEHHTVDLGAKEYARADVMLRRS